MTDQEKLTRIDNILIEYMPRKEFDAKKISQEETDELSTKAILALTEIIIVMTL